MKSSFFFFFFYSEYSIGICGILTPLWFFYEVQILQLQDEG